MMVDCAGNNVEVGDVIAAVLPHYSELILVTVLKITPQGVTIELPDGHKIWRASSQFCKVGE